MANKSSKAQNTRKFREKLEAVMDKAVPEGIDLELLLGMNLTEDELDRNYTYMDLLVMRLVKQGCAGHDKSIQEILDRLLGKPTQVNENLNISATYEDFLRDCREKDAIEAEFTEALPPPPEEPEEEDIFEELGL